MYNLGLNDTKFFKYLGLMALVLITIAVLCSSEFRTSFASNLVKTTGAVYVCLAFIYTFILLYRFSIKKNLILTLKEVLLTIVFIFSIYDIALLFDKFLMMTNRDLDAKPSNLITYAILLIFLVFQKLTFTENKS